MNIKINLIIIYSLLILFGLKGYGQTLRDTTKVPEFLRSELNYQLILEADSGKLEEVWYLLNLGADPNTSTWNGVTPLMYASQAGHYPVVRELIGAGAALNLTDQKRFTALHYAAINNNDSIAELLILNGGNPHAVNSMGVSPLHYASAYGYTFMAYLLLHYGASMDSTDNYGNTPLMAATYSGATAAAEYLLQNWAEVDKADRNGFTPLMVAAQFNDTTLLRLLTDYGANINKNNNTNLTALAIAIDSYADDAIKFLLNKGADIEEIHPKISYADLAKRNGYKDLASLLNKLGSPISRKPSFTAIIPSLGLMLNKNDFYFTTGLNSVISNYGIHAGLTLGFRPVYRPVLVDQEYSVYQFFEQRNMVGLSLGKEMLKARFKRKSHLGVLLGISYNRSWGYYTIISEQLKPKSQNILSPTVEISLVLNKLNLKLGTHYLLIDQLREQPLSFSISMGYVIDTSVPKISLKRIEWL
ncbi:MAG: ankyrin repeat domain-containing protein [Tenuifilaceae bacterium]|jgi:ankyrin repeat protein|nr:ankyrin repeat domain-containing protein [Tenuifilaceae bacterium]